MTTALVLLVLVGHAFVVSATHFHPGRQPGPDTTSYGARVGQLPDAQTSTPAGGHEQCLLCRLQRHFVSDLQQSAPALDAPPAEAHGRFRPLEGPARQAHYLVPSGRAPPSA